MTRQQVEDFLFQEAALLDEWRLDEWLALFDTSTTYEVPTTDRPNEDPHRSQYYVWDDYELLSARVKRLKSKHAHAENPHSRTRRLVTNVRLGERSDSSLEVRAAFLIYKIRDGNVDQFVGRYEHTLAANGAGLKFRKRRAVLELEVLRPGGRLSFIL
ncbi:MAG: aromatic-ring-hydroxylating dioxygenase subunit beta [Chloroflexi bacterium]|nr:MAG: aromatic-ring-hydroxylating dioxygenase subunit beta [Chloroflexota bacterium]